MIVNLWMSSMSIVDKKNENTPEKRRKQQMKEY